jgi:hypothetical protein
MLDEIFFVSVATDNDVPRLLLLSVLSLFGNVYNNSWSDIYCFSQK